MQEHPQVPQGIHFPQALPKRRESLFPHSSPYFTVFILLFRNPRSHPCKLHGEGYLSPQYPGDKPLLLGNSGLVSFGSWFAPGRAEKAL